MPSMRDYEEHRRARVTGGRRSRLVAVSVLGGALLLVLMIVLGSVDPPPAPLAAAVPSVAPTRTPAISAAERLYIVGQFTGSGFPSASQTVLRAYDTGKNTSVGTLASGQDQEFSPDGARMFIVHSTQVQAIDAATGQEAWHSPLTVSFTPTNFFQPESLLAVAPAGDILAVYRPQTRASQSGSIERFDARTGAALPPLRLNRAPRGGAVFIGADGTFFVATSNTVTAIDPASGAQHLIVEELGEVPISVTMDPAGQTLFILKGDELLKVATAPDSPVRRLPLGLDSGAGVYYSSVAIAPSGDRLALNAYIPGEPEISNGQLTSGPTRSKMIVINPQDGAILHQRVLTSYVYGASMSFNGSGTVLYYLEEGGVSAWDLTNDRQSRAISTRNDEPFWSQQLIRGPLVPIQPGSPAARSLSQLPPPPAAVPQPLPTPQVQADPAPFAWISQFNNGNQDVVEYATDGSHEVIASYVLASVDRPGLPPLLITSPASTGWVLFDPLDERTTPISMEVFLGRGRINPSRLALSPDGAQLAVVTERDPIKGDDLSSPYQLALIDVQTGLVRPLAAAPGQGSLFMQVYWADDGLYLVETRAMETGNIPARLLRLDPAAERPEPEELMDFGENGAYISLNAQAGVLVYEPYPEEIESSTLFVRNLRTGDESIIYAGTFIDHDGFMISPDGAWVAYLALPGGPDVRFDGKAGLHIYSLASGTTIRSIEGQHSFQHGWLRWTADSSAVVFRTYQYTDEAREPLIAEHRIATDGRVISERFSPLPLNYSFNANQRWSDDETLLVDLADRERYGLLQLIDRSGQVLVALPLDLEIVRNLGASEPNSSVQQIVYVFGGE
jgi:hypothetical protein